MSKHPIAERRTVRRVATASRKLLLTALVLTLLAITGCSGRLLPAAGRAEPSAPPTATDSPAARASTPTSRPVTPTVRRPTATFVPLITPSATPEGSPTRIIVPRISVEVAKQMAAAGEALLVDVRSRATFEEAHIAGAISLPGEELLDRYQELPTDRLIIFY